MLNKINRLTKDKDFDNVFQRGQASYNKITGAKAIVNQQRYSRFGILIGIKVSKKAVERNRAKRQIRGVIRLNMDRIKQGHDIIIIGLPDILNKDYQEIEKSIISNFIKLRLLKK